MRDSEFNANQTLARGQQRAVIGSTFHVPAPRRTSRNRSSWRMLALALCVLLGACGGGEPDADYFESGGMCYAKHYFNGSEVIHTPDYVAYPGACE